MESTMSGYGNIKIGWSDTRHEAVGKAAIQGRIGDTPVQQFLNKNDPEERRKEIEHAMELVRASPDEYVKE